MSNISKITQSLTTAEDMRNQTKLIMHPHANWEQYLTPAPLSIAILGELVFISSSTDFSINKNPPKDGYKFIKYPDSFRACLMQVCNSGWKAFNEAHSNMDQIRLHTAQVPNYMKAAVKLLFQDNDEVLKAHLPRQLDNIRRIADECLQLSADTKQYFTDVINIIHELLEACANAEGIYRDKMKEIKNKLEENELKKKSSEEANKRTEKAMKALEKQMAEARNDYQRALNSLPSGWDMVGMDFVNGLTKSMTTLVDGLVSNCISRLDRDSSANANSQSKNKDQESERDLFAEINAYSKSAEILKYVQNIQALMKVNCENDEIAWTNLFDEKSKCTKSEYITENLNRLKNNLNEITDCPAKKQAQDICTNGIEICNQLAKYAPDGKCDKDKSSEIITEVLNLNKSALYFDSSSKAITNSPAISPMPPMMQKEANRSGTMTPSQLATENARFAIEQTRAQLNKASESYEKSFENMEKNHKELTDILVDMRKCKLKEIDFKTTIKMLVKGMDAMGRVKVQWEKMVLFFQMVSNIVKTDLSQNLIDFVSTSEATQKISYDAKLYSKDLLYDQAFRASNIASLVNMISGTYTEIFDKYLMNRVSSLGKLMAMDKRKPEFEHERRQLQSGCEEAQKDILRLVLKNKEEFNRKSNERMEKIERELLAILPPVSSEKKKMIEDTVNNGFSNEVEEQYC